MSISLLFWLLMILALIGGFWVYRPTTAGVAAWGPTGYSLLLWVLLALLGLGVFGFHLQR